MTTINELINKYEEEKSKVDYYHRIDVYEDERDDSVRFECYQEILQDLKQLKEISSQAIFDADVWGADNDELIKKIIGEQ